MSAGRNAVTKLLGALGLVALWLPRMTVPLATSSCACGERGSAIVLEPSTIARPHVLSLGGACNGESAECMREDAEHRCEILWIVPTNEGRCTVTARFADGSTSEHTVEYALDGEYPCRGNIRPVRDEVGRL